MKKYINLIYTIIVTIFSIIPLFFYEDFGIKKTSIISFGLIIFFIVFYFMIKSFIKNLKKLEFDKILWKILILLPSLGFLLMFFP